VGARSVVTNSFRLPSCIAGTKEVGALCLHDPTCAGIRAHVTLLHTTARNGTQLCADPSLPITTLAHLYYRKGNSFWDCGLLSEKRACGCTHSSESGCIGFLRPTYCCGTVSDTQYVGRKNRATTEGTERSDFSLCLLSSIALILKNSSQVS